MIPETPRELRIEVKTSRSGGFQIGPRDIDGIGPGGYVAALLNDRLLHGPRWVLLPGRGLLPMGYDERGFAELEAAPELALSINRGWSDWILDRESWGQLLSEGAQNAAARIPWCRREHAPRMHQGQGNLREVKLDAALAAFRARLDEVAAGESGAQIEGQVHQALLGDVLEQLGYEVTLNPVGVPDIVAVLPVSATHRDVRSRLTAWVPDSAGLQDARDAILTLSHEELEVLIRQLRGA